MLFAVLSFFKFVDPSSPGSFDCNGMIFPMYWYTHGLSCGLIFDILGINIGERGGKQHGSPDCLQIHALTPIAVAP